MIRKGTEYRKVFFGRGCVKEYLACLTKGYGDTVMLAYGGGSVMDCRKAISMTARYEGNLWENFWVRTGIFDFEPLPLGVVATAAGTGSECNGRSVIANEVLMVKTRRDYPKCNPKFGLMDPVYTYSLPKFQMICGGFSVLSHIMESYLGGTDEDNVSDDLAEALMKNVIRSLRRAVRNPEDYTARGNLMWAGAMAENRIIRLGKPDQFQCRQMAYQLEANTGCSHGTGLADFIRDIGLPAALRELGVDENTDLRAIADSSAMVSGSCTRLTQGEILRIFQECYGEDC